MSRTYDPKAPYAVAHKSNGAYYDLNKMAWVFRPKDYKPEAEPKSKTKGKKSSV